MHELALFAGAGGGILGGALLGWRTVCAVEHASYPQGILLKRQRDGWLPRFPVWSDVCTFDGVRWRGHVDVVSGGFPCQDVSVAGKRSGIEGERSGLWSQMARIIGEVRPRFAFVENSPMLTSRGLGDVLGDLAEMGFDAEWGVLGAADVGARHQRDRIWLVAAHPDRVFLRKPQQRETRGWIDVQDGGLAELGDDGHQQYLAGSLRGRWATKSRVGRVAHGVASRVDRRRAIGNGQVPQCAAFAWRTLMMRMGLELR